MRIYSVFPAEYGSFRRLNKNDIIEPLVDTPDVNGQIAIRIWRNATLRFSQPNNMEMGLYMVYGNIESQTLQMQYTHIPAEWNMSLVYSFKS